MKMFVFSYIWIKLLLGKGVQDKGEQTNEKTNEQNEKKSSVLIDHENELVKSHKLFQSPVRSPSTNYVRPLRFL